MNQIPNREGEIKALRPNLLPTIAEMDLYEREIIKLLHHQLQKARQDWLREEITKVACMKEPLPSANDHREYNRGVREGVQLMRQTIIDRYHSELDQDKTK